MRRIEEYQIPVCHYRKRPRKQSTSDNWIWVPKVPSWEKDFCYKIGLFTWDDFLKAKKLTKYSHKVLQWNDSAAEEAFHKAKNSFFAEINGLPNPNQSSIPNPDLYIDEIAWDDDNNDDDDEDDNDDIVTDPESRSGKDEDNGDGDGCYKYDIRIEDIKPTGWDIDVEEFSAGKVLTGLVVGGME